MPFYYSQAHGCVYALDPQDSNGMVYTPLSAKNTFNGNIATWIEVDELALLGEEESIRQEVEYAFSLLSSYLERYLDDQ